MTRPHRDTGRRCVVCGRGLYTVTAGPACAQCARTEPDAAPATPAVETAAEAWPAPVTLRDGWRSDAACRGTPIEMWYPTARGSTPDSTAAWAAARDICAGCPVAAECLTDEYRTGGHSNHGPYGIRAGLNSHVRRLLYRRWNKAGHSRNRGSGNSAPREWRFG